MAEYTSREAVLHRLLKKISKETQEELLFTWDILSPAICVKCDSALTRKDCHECLTRRLFVDRKIKAVKG